jgi:hypothetical protein
MFLYLSPLAGYAAFFSTIWPFIPSMVTLSGTGGSEKRRLASYSAWTELELYQ